MDFCFSSFPYWLLPFPNILIVKNYLFITRGFCHSFEFWLYLQASDGCKLFICLYLFRWLGHWLSFRICHFFCEIHLWHCWRNVSLYIFSRYGKQLYTLDLWSNLHGRFAFVETPHKLYYSYLHYFWHVDCWY